MYNNVSDKYTAHIADSIVRRPKSKIVVGGVTYTGETALMSFPKISHSAERLIGVFPAKTCELELLNRDGNISLNGREITVYRGFEIDGETEWVPMGIFSATDDNITNELTKRTIKFKGTDRSSRFDTSFVNDIDYPCTILNFVQHICERHGVELETTSFAFANRILLSAPNSDASISDREIIARIAELSGCLAVISRVGGLRIFKPESTGKTVSKWYYKTVSQEPKFGEITAVTLGHSTYTDDIVYPEGATDSAVNWRIDDNPFVDGAIANADGTPAIRADIIADVAQNIIGRSIIPFSVTDFIDDYIYDLGDVITVEKKDGSTFETVILNISSNSRIRSNIGAATQTQSSTNYTLAGSTKQQTKKLALEVDYQAGLIRGIVEDADGMRTTIQALSDKIDLKFEDLTDPDHLDIEHITSISAEGVKIYNGKIQIFKGDKDSSEMIFGTDENGSLGVTGNIKVKFKNANGSDTATLKISNEDFEDDIGEYATASIKVENASGEVFSNISMWEYEGVGTISITSDNISLSNENGTVSINIGAAALGNSTSIGVIGDLVLYDGDIELAKDMYVGGIITTSSNQFEGYRHVRYTGDMYGMLKPGVGYLSYTENVDYASNNLATTKKNIDGRTYDVVMMNEKKLIPLSKLRYTSGITKLFIEFTAGKYGWTKYYFAYTTEKDGPLISSESYVLVNYWDESKNHDRFTFPNIPIPKGAVQWCVAVEPHTAGADFYAGWYNVIIKESRAKPTAALELLDDQETIMCRLDCFASDGEALVVLQGKAGSETSGRLELGADKLYWGGGIVTERIEGSSEASIKTNIQPASSMLDKVCESGIFSYNYKSELCNKSQKALAPRYGLVIGDGYNTPEEVISSDGKHVDLYSMIALAWKAIQELADKFDTEVKK